MAEFNPNLKVQPYELAQMQSLPLEAKVIKSQMRIKEWYEYWNGQVYISFSGGKDSTVLASVARDIFPDIPLVFINTGNEFPEIVRFVKSVSGVTWLRPQYTIKEIFDRFGFPVISKDQSRFISDVRSPTVSARLKALRLSSVSGHSISQKWRFMLDAPFKISDRCCYYLKESILRKYERSARRRAIMGTMASDSVRRKFSYLKSGCNLVTGNNIASKPLSFWLEKDIWEYIHQRGLPYSDIYDMGYERTGCFACGFGCHLKKPNQMQLLKQTHPKLWLYCMDYLGMREVLTFAGIPIE